MSVCLVDDAAVVLFVVMLVVEEEVVKGLDEDDDGEFDDDDDLLTNHDLKQKLFLSQMVKMPMMRMKWSTMPMKTVVI